MSIGLTPYFRFAGYAAEAMEFYRSALGGELTMMTFAEGSGEQNPAFADQIMHASLYVDRGLHLMASDTPPEMNVGPNGSVALSSNGTDEADNARLRNYWEALQEGSRIDVPLETAPWGDAFGMLTDKFGVTWMFNMTAARS